MEMQNAEGFDKGIGRKDRRAMIRRWKQEGIGLSLKEWARQAGVCDAANVWIEHKRGI